MCVGVCVCVIVNVHVFFKSVGQRMMQFIIQYSDSTFFVSFRVCMVRMHERACACERVRPRPLARVRMCLCVRLCLYL